MRALLVFLLTSGGAAAAEWPESITTALFADADFTTLRPAEEIAQNWALLTEEDRATLRRDCAAEPVEGTPGPDAVARACEALPAE
ncbi:hypothetical protein QCN27_00565 [Cereibacter sp. SYSU M97828]|nr:hypothetical protein [Cereibacter flavus]